MASGAVTSDPGGGKLLPKPRRRYPTVVTFGSRLALATLGVLAAALGVGNCAIDGFELVDGQGGSGVTTSGTGGASGGSGGCAHTAPPAAPSSGDPGGSNEVAVALRVIDLGDETVMMGIAPGYDLDSYCTCNGDGASCQRPPWLTADPCDAAGGIDNSLAQVFGAGSAFSSRLSSDFHNANLGSGLYSTVVHVTGYNGEADDPQVTVALYPSPGLGRDPCNPPNPSPMWNGSDRWPVLDSALTNTGGSGGAGGSGGGPSCSTAVDIADARYLDDAAYVSGNVLVAQIDQAEIILDSIAATVVFDATSVVVSARLEQVTGGWGLRDGTIAGIVELQEAFRAIAEHITEGQLVCTNHALYNVIKTAVCRVPDITVTPAGPTQVCDAVSFGIGFGIADPITLGSAVPTPPGPGTCPMGEKPEEDGCENYLP